MNLTRLITAVLLVAALTTAPALAAAHKKKVVKPNGEIVYIDVEDEGADDQGNQGNENGDAPDSQKTMDAVLFGY